MVKLRIRNLVLKNFHGFVERDITFNDRFTVLIGDNGSGKTAILDGLAVALGAYLLAFPDVHTRYIHPDEVHRKSYVLGEITDVQPQYPVEVISTGVVQGLDITWSRSVLRKRGTTTRVGASEFIKLAEREYTSVSAGNDVALPIISYYGTGRLWVQKKQKSVNRFKASSRIAGYTDCLGPASNEKLFTKWFNKMVLTELQRGKPLAVLSAVRDAVSHLYA